MTYPNQVLQLLKHESGSPTVASTSKNPKLQFTVWRSGRSTTLNGSVIDMTSGIGCTYPSFKDLIIFGQGKREWRGGAYDSVEHEASTNRQRGNYVFSVEMRSIGLLLAKALGGLINFLPTLEDSVTKRRSLRVLAEHS